MMRLFLLSAVCSILLVFACNKDDDDNTGMPISELEVTINGENFTVANMVNTLSIRPAGDRTLHVFEFIFQVDGGDFGLTITNYDFQDPPENGILTKNYPIALLQDADDVPGCMAPFTCDFVPIFYNKEGKLFVPDVLPIPERGFINITSIDTANKTITGSF